MKNIKLVALFIALLCCNALVAQNSGSDQDGDGVLDEYDVCPNAKGSKENKGCPSEKPKALLIPRTLDETIIAIIKEGKKNFLPCEYVLEEFPDNYFGGEEPGDKNYKFALSIGADGEYVRFVYKLKKRVFYADFYGLNYESKQQGEKVKESLDWIFSEYEKLGEHTILRSDKWVKMYDLSGEIVIGYYMNDDKSLLTVSTQL